MQTAVAKGFCALCILYGRALWLWRSAALGTLPPLRQAAALQRGCGFTTAATFAWALESSTDSFEVSENQFRQIFAVATFQNAEHRNSQSAHRFSEPVKILRLQCFLCDWVA